MCAGCHGADGNHRNSTWTPQLAEQIRSYLVTQLLAFRAGERPNLPMPGIAADLSDQDITELTAFFSSRTPAGVPWDGQDATLVERGAELFALGNRETGVIACAICHGPFGEGVDQTRVPRIIGQSPDYLWSCITTFAVWPDTGNPEPSAMTIIARQLSREEIDAVVAFLTSRPFQSLFRW